MWCSRSITHMTNNTYDKSIECLEKSVKLLSTSQLDLTSKVDSILT